MVDLALDDEIENGFLLGETVYFVTKYVCDIKLSFLFPMKKLKDVRLI